VGYLNTRSAIIPHQQQTFPSPSSSVQCVKSLTRAQHAACLLLQWAASFDEYLMTLPCAIMKGLMQGHQQRTCMLAVSAASHQHQALLG